MSKLPVFAVLFLLLAGLAGCAAGGEGRSPLRTPHGHLIFNPPSSPIGPVDVGRAEWPSATDYSLLGEEVVYEVRIIDWQGRLGNNDSSDQYYYRRFSSIRAGAARR